MSTPLKNLRVVWIEDAEYWYVEMREVLIELARDYGFELVITRFVDDTDFRELASQEPIDLALIDHKLRNNVTGDVLCQMILDWQIVHAVIYYSENMVDVNHEHFNQYTDNDVRIVTCIHRPQLEVEFERYIEALGNQI